MAKAPPCPDRTMQTSLPQQSSSSAREEEGHWVLMEDRRRRRIAFENSAMEMLRYQDNSDDVKVGITELQERLDVSENRFFCSASGPAGEEVLCIGSWARWDAQLKGLVELERRCRDTRQEIQVKSESQEISESTMEDKLKLQSRANERYHDQIFEEMKELEQNRSERRLQSSGNSRRIRKVVLHPLNRADLRWLIITKK